MHIETIKLHLMEKYHKYHKYTQVKIQEHVTHKTVIKGPSRDLTYNLSFGDGVYTVTKANLLLKRFINDNYTS